MKCPKDNNDLETETYETMIDVDRCPVCRSLWLDHGELEKIQGTVERDYAEEISRLPDLVGQAYAMALAGALPPVTCPNCSTETERREHSYCSQVLIDVCPKCRGIWLDEGEIKALEVFFERARVETARMRSGFFASLGDFVD